MKQWAVFSGLFCFGCVILWGKIVYKAPHHDARYSSRTAWMFSLPVNVFRGKVSAIFAKYAGILASEGETQTALKYVNNGNTESGAILLDR